jgi:hypothetical protein
VIRCVQALVDGMFAKKTIGEPLREKTKQGRAIGRRDEVISLIQVEDRFGRRLNRMFGIVRKWRQTIHVALRSRWQMTPGVLPVDQAGPGYVIYRRIGVTNDWVDRTRRPQRIGLRTRDRAGDPPIDQHPVEDLMQRRVFIDELARPSPRKQFLDDPLKQSLKNTFDRSYKTFDHLHHRPPTYLRNGTSRAAGASQRKVEALMALRQARCVAGHQIDLDIEAVALTALAPSRDVKRVWNDQHRKTVTRDFVDSQ